MEAMRVDDEYGAVLTPDWHERVRRDEHPADGAYVFASENFEHGKPGLLLLHGVSNNGGTWQPIVPALSELAPVVAPTLGAHLLADERGGRAETIDALLDYLAEVTPPPWRLVGHSMGGVISGLIMRYRPDLVSGAVLLNSPLPGVTRRIRDGDRLDRTGRALLMLKTLARVTVFGRPRLPRLLRGPEMVVVRTALGGFVVHPGRLDDRVVSRAVMAARTTDGMEFLDLARELPEREFTPFTERPVSIVLGRTDPLTPPIDYDEIRWRYPAADVHVIEECSHFAHLEQPAATVRVIRHAFGG